ncbi:tripartite tricarboxylate transporter TctB family protein [Salinicola rhizosphaerae]|uniref:DUF1468 domain-containing protein n=1 Tax=Salinicola rhizosphaerae TaxID=1443141 RepID=A0ABQ3DZE1_9GAMM|nr:tripartite tricarboxylate transporter TctB family protein [Salinicola rhizosphaerae]GHB20629.1 hypothetical protein GCM10009038_19230 [Salinicola rhizosphaerae]
MNHAVEATSRSEREVDHARGKALANTLFNVALAALFSALFVQAGELPSSMWEPLGAGSFPRLVLGALVVFNLALIVQSIGLYRRAPQQRSVGFARWCHERRLAFGTLFAFAIYALTMPWIGFMLASLAFLLTVQWLLGARHGRRLVVAIVVAIVFSVGLYALFSHVFLISLPKGRLW